MHLFESLTVVFPMASKRIFHENLLHCRVSLFCRFQHHSKIYVIVPAGTLYEYDGNCHGCRHNREIDVLSMIPKES